MLLATGNRLTAKQKEWRDFAAKLQEEQKQLADELVRFVCGRSVRSLNQHRQQ